MDSCAGWRVVITKDSREGVLFVSVLPFPSRRRQGGRERTGRDPTVRGLEDTYPCDPAGYVSARPRFLRVYGLFWVVVPTPTTGVLVFSVVRPSPSFRCWNFLVFAPIRVSLPRYFRLFVWSHLGRCPTRPDPLGGLVHVSSHLGRCPARPYPLGGLAHVSLSPHPCVLGPPKEVFWSRVYSYLPPLVVPTFPRPGGPVSFAVGSLSRSLGCACVIPLCNIILPAFFSDVPFFLFLT